MKTLLNYFYNLILVVKKFISNWNEIITIPLSLVLWYLSPTFLRWLDPTAATFDSGVLQNYLLASIGLLFSIGSSRY